MWSKLGNAFVCFKIYLIQSIKTTQVDAAALQVSGLTQDASERQETPNNAF